MHTDPAYFFESILYRQFQFPFLDLHGQRIAELGQQLGLSLDFDIQILDYKLKKSLLNSEDEQKLRLQFKIDGDTLAIDKIESTRTDPYRFQKYPSIALVTYPHYAKPIDALGRWKRYDKQLYQDSIEYAMQAQATQSLILNKNKEVVETSLSNFYFIQNGILYTPPLKSGAVNGVFRRFLASHMTLVEKNLLVSELGQIEQCFISSAIRGIVPVHSIDNRPYPFDMVGEFQEKLNLIFAYTFIPKRT